MTDRVKGCWVAFEKDIRDDDVESLLNAIRHIRHVAAVSTDDCIADHDDWMNREQIRRDTAWIASTVLHGLLSNTVSYCHDKDKTISALQGIIDKLKAQTT